MKLYTEEEIRRTFGFGLNKINFEGYMNAMTPVLLPNDEEIDNATTEYTWKLGFNVKSYVGDVYKDGAKWMRDKILKQ